VTVRPNSSQKLKLCRFGVKRKREGGGRNKKRRRDRMEEKYSGRISRYPKKENRSGKDQGEGSWEGEKKERGYEEISGLDRGEGGDEKRLIPA